MAKFDEDVIPEIESRVAAHAATDTHHPMDSIREAARQEVTVHATGVEHLSRADVQEMIDAAVAGLPPVVTPPVVTPPVVTPPVVTPPVVTPPGVRTATRIPRMDLLVELDPHDLTTFAPPGLIYNMQRIVAGNMINSGQWADQINQGAGYGLRFNAAGEVHSWPLSNGEGTLRFGPVVRDGVRWLRLAGQFKGYPVSQGGDGSYNWQGWTNGQLPSLDRRDGQSDPGFWGGLPRTQASMIADDWTEAAHGIQVEDSALPADDVWLCSELMVRPHHYGREKITGGIDIHSPGGGVTGPVVTTIEAGRYRVWGKASTSPVVYNSGNLPSSSERVYGEVDLPAVGDTLTVILRARIRPTGGGIVQAWTVDESGWLHQFIDYSGPVGYRYTDPKWNRRFYLIPAQLYVWQPTWGPQALNFDPTTADGPSRILDIRGAVGVRGRGVRGWSVDDLARHVMWWRSKAA